MMTALVAAVGLLPAALVNRHRIRHATILCTGHDRTQIAGSWQTVVGSPAYLLHSQTKGSNPVCATNLAVRLPPPNLFEPVHRHIQTSRCVRWIGRLDDHDPAVAREIEIGCVRVEKKPRRAGGERR